MTHTHTAPTKPNSGIAAYKALILVLTYVSGIAWLAAGSPAGIDWKKAMNVFMSGFFLSFSFFKFLDLKGFAENYSTYDIVAKRFRGWAYIYAFAELLLGIAYAVGFQPLITNAVAFILMSVSIVGVLQSVLNKRPIRCACLGAVFNLPMSTVTVVEDAVMILMSGAMLLHIL